MRCVLLMKNKSTTDQQPETDTSTNTNATIGDSIIKGLRRDSLSRVAKRRVTVRTSDCSAELSRCYSWMPNEIVLNVGTNHSSGVFAQQIVDLGNLFMAKLQNTGPLIYISLNHKSAYCIILRSSKEFKTCIINRRSEAK